MALPTSPSSSSHLCAQHRTWIRGDPVTLLSRPSLGSRRLFDKMALGIGLFAQTLPHQVGAAERVSDVARGAYVLREEQGELEAIVIATGSEVALAIDAAEKLSAAGRGVRVVSMPCADVFERQDAVYREAVLPSHILARVAVEASHMDWWYKYVGLDGRVVGMSSFGESAPGPQLMKEFGFTVENVVDAIEDVILS